METKTNVALGIVAVAPVIVPFASGPLAASEALAFGASIEASFVASAAGVAGEAGVAVVVVDTHKKGRNTTEGLLLFLSISGM